MKRYEKVAAATVIIASMCVAPVFGDNADRLSPLAAGYLERTREMINAGNPTGGIDQLRHIAASDIALSAEEAERYAYLLAMSMYERGDKECIALLEDFASGYPASPYALGASMAAADAWFFAGKYPKALMAYDSLDFNRINPGDRPMYIYRKTFSLIKTGHYDEAVGPLRQLASIKEFSTASTYYLAYIDYIKENYAAARKGFEKVARSGAAAQPDIYPEYYIAQIDYTQGDYARAASLGERLLDEKPVAELTTQTLRVIGLSYFKLGDYDKAYRILTRYMASESDTPESEARYALGAIEYMRGNDDRAEQLLDPVASEDTRVGQGASLYLGLIAARKGNDSAAAIALDRAYRLRFDEKVTEVALFNYVAARTHGGNIPFNSSIDLLERFLQQFPGSEYVSAAREYLATAYYQEKNYAKALESIDKISSPSQKVLAAKQKVTFGFGRQLMENGEAASAVKYLRQSVELSRYDRALGQQARLWLADAEYNSGQYSAAVRDYKEYLAAATRSTNTTLAVYNLAYAYYMQDKYSLAAKEFSRVFDSSPALPKTLYNDAITRLADCQYYTGDYRSAAGSYSRAIAAGGAEADYASFRHAVMTGLAGDISGKIRELNVLCEKYPDSRWLPDAILECGLTYTALGQDKNAEREFERLARLYPDNPQARKGLLNLAINYSRQGEGELSARTYQRLIERWPSSEEARLANEDLRRWHASNGTLGEYSQFLNSIPDAPRLDASEVERLEYDAAREALDTGDGSIDRLEKYVAQYPDGKYVADALSAIAEESYAKGKIPEALRAYRDLAAKGGAEYAPEAWAGIMRTTSDPSERIAYSRRVAGVGGVSADRLEEASLYEAIGLEESKRTGEARKIYRRLAASPSTLAGARAAVALGEGLLADGDLREAEQVLTDFTDAGSPHQYWLARGFIALADTYAALGKKSLARQYVESLRENYPGKEADIHSMISERLRK